MELSGLELIHARDSKHLTLQPNEKIGKKYFFRYLITQLENKHLFLEDFTHYYFTFCENTLSYEVILLNANSNNFIYEPFIFQSFYKENQPINSVDIFVTENFFCLFKNGQFFLSKLIHNVKEDELKLFISQAYKLDITNIYTIAQDQLKELKQAYLKSHNGKQKFKQLKTADPFKYFLLFNTAATVIFALLLINGFSSKELTDQKTKPNYSYIINSHNQNILQKPLNALGYIKENKLHIKTFELKNNKSHIILQNKEKTKLLKFAAAFAKDKITINSIIFNKELSTYIMDVTLGY